MNGTRHSNSPPQKWFCPYPNRLSIVIAMNGASHRQLTADIIWTTHARENSTLCGVRNLCSSMLSYNVGWDGSVGITSKTGCHHYQSIDPLDNQKDPRESAPSCPLSFYKGLMCMMALPLIKPEQSAKLIVAYTCVMQLFFWAFQYYESLILDIISVKVSARPFSDLVA